jgi:hypothetical protein
MAATVIFGVGGAARQQPRSPPPPRRNSSLRTVLQALSRSTHWLVPQCVEELEALSEFDRGARGQAGNLSRIAALNVSQESGYQAFSSSGVPNPAVRKMFLIVFAARAPNGCSAKGCNCARWNRCAGIAVPREGEESVDMRDRLEYGSV